MVVTKRAPVPPMPSSRTHSTQQLPRVRGKAPSDLSDTIDAPGPLSDGTTEGESEVKHGDQPAAEQDTNHYPPKKKSSKIKSKSKQKKGGKKSSSGGSTFFDFLSRIFILWFTIYSLSVCPQDTQLKSPVCRGLSEYRRLVIDPYVMPPVRLALGHPSVAPYIQKAKPYKDRAVATAKPIVQRTLHEWNARVIPQWNKLAVPLWKRYAVPQFQRLDAQVAPYRARITHEYERRVGSYVRQVSPYVEKATGTLSRWQQKSRPYVVLAAHKTYDGYRRAAPYARPVGEKMKVLLARLIVFLAEKRRQFVDPHVQMLWERVKELSSGGPRAPAAAEMRDSITSHISKASEGAASVVSSLIHAQTQSLDSLLPSDAGDNTDVPVVPDVLSESTSHLSTVRSTSPTSFSNDAAEQVASLASSIPTVAHDTASILDAASVTLSSAASSASSYEEAALPSVSLTPSFGTVASEAATEALSSGSSIVSSVTDHLFQSAFSVSDAATAALSHAPESIASSARHASSALSSGMSSVTDQVAASVTPVIASPSASLYQEDEDSDIDLDAFYAELGLQEVISEPSAPTAGSVSYPPVKSESEEEKAERKRIRDAKMAEKRADIMFRHTKWEQDLAESIELNKKALRQALVTLRKAAAAELKESAEIRAEIESLVEEAEKFLRGAEKYLQTLSKEGRTEQEKRAMWERVTDKVDEKFADRLSQTEAVVNGWYMPVLDKELAEVRKVTDAVRDIADRAQTDIGMDYAYLDDVTYNDWQRYHDLLRSSDNFTNVANSIQNGSDPSPPFNPVLDEILDLQAEVQDVVVGFETRLRRIKRTGERVLGDGGQQTESEPQDDESVSILPIEDEGKTQSPADIGVPPVVIGRSKEEVMDALNRLVEQDGQATSAPQAKEQPSDPEVAVRSLTEEDDSSYTESSLVHEEL